MLKFILFLMFMLLIKNKNIWLNKELLLILSFMFIFLIIPSFYNFFYFNLVVDYLSYGIIFLRGWISRLMLLAREKLSLLKNFINLFLSLIIFLTLFLFFRFRVDNLFIFYLFFEIRLIPTLFLILG